MSIPQAGAWALGAALACSLAACSPALNWREVRPPGGAGFVALFPCQPDIARRDVALPGMDRPAAMQVLACEADGVQWSLSHVDAGTVQARAAALPALVRALWGNLSLADPARAAREPLAAPQVRGATPHLDAQGWWLQGARPAIGSRTQAVGARAWYFSKGTMVYQAAAMGPTLRRDDPRLRAFEDSFNFPP